MATTSNQLIDGMNRGQKVPAPIAASTTIYAGTLVFWERTSGSAEGYALGDDDGGNNNFAGIAVDKYDNSSGSAGDVTGELYQKGQFVLEGSGFHQGIVGEKAYATDNWTVTASSSSSSYIGTFVEFISATKARVNIDPHPVDA